MTIIDRDGASVTTEDLEALVRLDEPAPARPSDRELHVSLVGAVLLAALSASAGVIHLVMVPSHASAWLVEGVAFAVAGWLQIGLAVLFVARPSRAALRVSCVANVAFIAVWAVSRRWGLPVGPEASVAQAATFVDVTCVVLEGVLVLVGAVLLARPTLGAHVGPRARAAMAVVPLGILCLATAAIASPSAANHAHGGAATHDEAVVAGGAAAAEDHDHGQAGAAPRGAASAASAADHDHGAAAPGDDKGLSLIMNGAGEGGGHVHSNEVVPVDPATQQQLDAQLAKMQPFIEKYPTVRDAEAAGYHRQGPYSPGLGAHYAESGRPQVGVGPTMTDEALRHPMLIFDGVAPESKLAGFMYMIFSLDTQHPPEGFVGPNDHWHFHTNVCLKFGPDGSTDAPLGADTSATKELCDTYGGLLIANTGYMAHVWPVPGYESPQGLFSNLNAKLTCPDGTYYVVPPEELGLRTNACKDVPH